MFNRGKSEKQLLDDVVDDDYDEVTGLELD